MSARQPSTLVIGGLWLAAAGLTGARRDPADLQRMLLAGAVTSTICAAVHATCNRLERHIDERARAVYWALAKDHDPEAIP